MKNQMTHHDSKLNEIISLTSTAPGVYLMKDADEQIIYIGKAKNLKKRLTAYLKNTGQMDLKTGVLVKKIADLETVITRTEKEALILESNLIKRHKPRYNVILKDDKRYPSLRIDLTEKYPRFTIVRKIGEDDALYFGPFASALAVRQSLNTINKTFKLRKCRSGEFKTRNRPCLHCQMAGCLAPCCMDVNPRHYRENINEAIMFLKGQTSDLLRKVKMEMGQAAESQEFEKAARLRDKMFSLERTIEKQIAVTTDFKDRDVFAIARAESVSLISMFIVRGGFLSGTRHFDFKDTLSTDDEILGTFIRQYYDRPNFLPDEILTSTVLQDRRLLEEWLRNLKHKRVSIRHPQRGEKRKLMDMAVQNAGNELSNILLSRSKEVDLLHRLQKRLNLMRFPKRIECFDNSNLSGTEPVSSMVVFKAGQAHKAAYRKYRIRTVNEPDDYAYMSEVLARRFGKGEDSKPYPDLLILDGGKGQLNIAAAVLSELNLNGVIDLLGIAKKDESKGERQDKVFTLGRVNAVSFGKQTDLLLFLQRIRDEAHRFAIAFHRNRRSKVAMQSALDTIPGVGVKRKAVLLKHFKSIKKIREATVEDFLALPGFNRRVAQSVHNALSDRSRLS
ncbi:MAG: excinuclease ABC subunit UvrC [Desulfobacterales bacterium]|jgi:excinuclease ABC subunit C